MVEHKLLNDEIPSELLKFKKPPELPPLSDFTTDTLWLVHRTLTTVQKVGAAANFLHIITVFGATAFGLFTVSAILIGFGVMLGIADLIYYSIQYARSRQQDKFTFTGILARIAGTVVFGLWFAMNVAIFGIGTPGLLVAGILTSFAVVTYFIQREFCDNTYGSVTKKMQQIAESITIVSKALAQERNFIIAAAHIPIIYHQIKDIDLQDMDPEKLTNKRNTILALTSVLELLFEHAKQLEPKEQTLQQKAPLKFALLTSIPCALLLIGAVLMLGSVFPILGISLGVAGPAVAVLVATFTALRFIDLVLDMIPEIKHRLPQATPDPTAITINIIEEYNKQPFPKAILKEDRAFLIAAEKIIAKTQPNVTPSEQPASQLTPLLEAHTTPKIDSPQTHISKDKPHPWNDQR